MIIREPEVLLIDSSVWTSQNTGPHCWKQIWCSLRGRSLGYLTADLPNQDEADQSRDTDIYTIVVVVHYVQLYLISNFCCSFILSNFDFSF